MSECLPRAIPEVSGQLDAAYLTASLARAGLEAPAHAIDVEPLLDGRTGSTVQRVRVGERSFVLKHVRGDSWRIVGAGLKVGGEPHLWAHGVLRDIPGAIECPIIDVGYEPSANRYWMLMEDVGADIRDRGRYTRADSTRLYAALATMQARHDADTLRDAPIPAASDSTDLFRLPMLHLSGRARNAAWVPEMLEDFKVLGAFLPVFLDLLGSRLADAYLDLAADDEWVRMLDAEPPTLLHGDLRRANISMRPDSISLFDWEFCARGPAGCDLQWHNLANYWAYPPEGVEPGDDCDDLADLYVRRLADEHRGSVDRAAFERGWKLGWIRVMAEVGYVLIDPLYPNGADEATTARIRDLCQRSVRRALDMRDAL